MAPIGNRLSIGLHWKSVLAAVLVAATVGLAPAQRAAAAFPGTNGKIAFAKLTGATTDIYVMNANGSGETPLTTNPASDNLPAWSPDGTRIAFHSNRDGNNEIYVMNADGSGQTRLTSNAFNDLNPSWTPDGSRIAFDSDRDGNFEIYVMTPAGTGQTRLTFSAANDNDPAWSPDGTLIAYQSSGVGFSQIYTMNANGSNPVPRTTGPDIDNSPSWSPDGTRIAFVRSVPGNAEIFVMKADGANPTNVSNHPSADLGPAWSPDGTRVAFATNRTGSYEIFAMNADGSNQTQFVANAERDLNPDWQPLPVPGSIAITVSGFEGTSFLDNCALGTTSCFQVPYTMGAVGTSQFVETNTGSIAVYDKASGALLAPRQPISQFWLGTGSPSGLSNAGQRVLFDHYSSRWLTTATGDPGSDVFIAVSDTADALGSWKFTRIVGAASGGAGAFADLPTLGMDDKAVYVATDNFNPPSFAFAGTSLFSIPKADLFGGAPTTTNRTRFDTAASAPDSAFTIQGAVNWGGNPTPTASILAASSTGNGLYFYQLLGVNGAGALRTPSVLIPTAQDSRPRRARQPDGSRVIDTTDTRILNPVYEANGKLYAVRTVEPVFFNYAVVRWSVHEASTGALIEEGDIAGEVGFDYYQGSIAANQFGEVVIGYNRSGGADKGLAGRISFVARTFRTDAAGGLDQFGPEILLRVSDVSDYHGGLRPNTGTNIRWGPTSAVTVDPLFPRRFFAIGQYAADWAVIPGLGANEFAVWHTYIARITFGPDTDGDGFADTADNCTLQANPTQLDADSDGYGNICDADLNNSGLVTTADFGILRSVLNQSAGSSANAAAADLNGSGTVTTADFAILRARLNTAPGPSGLLP